MKTSACEWNHKWFGFWREMDRAFRDCPSIHDFIDPECEPQFDKEAVATYLENAQIIAAASRMSFPCVLTGKLYDGSICERTDGEWLWLDDLGYYVREHNVCIPKEMLDSMKRNDFKPPPDIPESEIEKLDHPPIR